MLRSSPSNSIPRWKTPIYGNLRILSDSGHAAQRLVRAICAPKQQVVCSLGLYQDHFCMKKTMLILVVMNCEKSYWVSGAERVHWKFVLSRIQRDDCRTMHTVG